ncbi:MAG TPA: SRPBCC domain-containing protein [Longimicrobium sp.]|nr:SRPBCC domain-containing protein [Longimicrobium sp.]
MSIDTTSPATPVARDESGEELVISRTFAAPRELVWRAWTGAEHLSRWFAPHGATVEVVAADARPGGTLHFCHHLAGGEEVWVRGVYREVDAPRRLVIEGGFSDAEGNERERPGFFHQTRMVVTFTEEPGGTRVTIRQGLDADRGESRGWSEQLDRLAGYLAEIAG